MLCLSAYATPMSRHIESLSQYVADISAITGPDGRRQRKRHLAEKVPLHMQADVKREVIRYFERRQRNKVNEHNPAFE